MIKYILLLSVIICSINISCAVISEVTDMHIDYTYEDDYVFIVNFTHTSDVSLDNQLLNYDYHIPISNVTMISSNPNAELYWNTGELVVQTGEVLPHQAYEYNITIYKQQEATYLLDTIDWIILIAILLLAICTYINKVKIGSEIIAAVSIFIIINIVKTLALTFNTIFYCILLAVIMYWNYAKITKDDIND